MDPAMLEEMENNRRMLEEFARQKDEMERKFKT